jgi:5'-methylthioadenosine phosphorylase
LCQGFIDLSARRITAFSDTVEHRDFTEPFSNRLSQLVLESAIKQGVTICEGGIYANLDGPRYETPQEIEALKVLGANVVGMTAASEAIVMRELNVPYACVCVVTNAAAGIQGDALNHQEVVEVMEMKGKVLLDLLLNTARSIGADWE